MRRGAGMRYARPMDVAPMLEEMTSLVAEAATNEGVNPTAIPGLFVYRVTRPRTFWKLRTAGPRLSVIVRGKKVVSVRGQDFVYDRSKSLVLSGETDMVGEIVSPEPFLSFCYELPPA